MFDEDDEDNICEATDDDNDEEDVNKQDQILMMTTTMMMLMVMMYYNDSLSKDLSNPVNMTYCKRNENIELKKIIGLIWSLDKYTLLQLQINSNKHFLH